MEYQDILLEKRDGIATLTLNRPEKLNALNPEMMVELVHAFRKVNLDDEAKVLVITGAGRGFCSGIDLAGQAGNQGSSSNAGEKAGAEIEGISRDAFPREAPLALAGMKKPVIAAINGVAVGGGLTLTLSCDIRIASETARFSIPLTRLGFTFELGSSYFLSRIIGIGKACELVFTGRMIDAKEAKEIGLVNQVVPADQLTEIAHEMASNIAKAAPLAQEISKMGLYQGLDADLPTQLRWEVLANGYLGTTQDRREAIRAFMEKRDPVFEGR
jgi:2-(1,2-epoxy-1,2-dihydrophenyl)acetyl-CoA isomerase